MVSVLAFHDCGKIPEKMNLKGGKVYFGLQFPSMIAWTCYFGPVVA
jgi:hypothetical protein